MLNTNDATKFVIVPSAAVHAPTLTRRSEPRTAAWRAGRRAARRTVVRPPGVRRCDPHAAGREDARGDPRREQRAAIGAVLRASRGGVVDRCTHVARAARRAAADPDRRPRSPRELGAAARLD